MNINTRSRALGATALLAVLLGSAACGTDTVSDSDPGTQPGIEARIYPPVSVPPAPVTKGGGGRISADAAERSAAAEKARQDRASTLRWARGSQVGDKLDQAGQPGRP
jgi:hypothetical protein